MTGIAVCSHQLFSRQTLPVPGLSQWKRKMLRDMIPNQYRLMTAVATTAHPVERRVRSKTMPVMEPVNRTPTKPTSLINHSNYSTILSVTIECDVRAGGLPYIFLSNLLSTLILPLNEDLASIQPIPSCQNSSYVFDFVCFYTRKE